MKVNYDSRTDILTVILKDIRFHLSAASRILPA